MADQSQFSLKKRRGLNVRHAVASAQLEGIIPSPELQTKMRFYADGLMSAEQVLDETRRKHALAASRI
jgi:predicted acylesterase/phospholipase RssA